MFKILIDKEITSKQTFMVYDEILKNDEVKLKK